MLLWERATSQGMKTAGMEKPEAQMLAFVELAEEQQVTLLAETLKFMKKERAEGKDMIQDLIDAYLSGEPLKVASEMDRAMRDMAEGEHKELGEIIMKRLLTDRDKTMTEFIVTSLKKRNARWLYEDVYCRRGQAENHIKSWKTHLAADRTSCTKASANQLRLFLHAGAYWLMWGLRMSMPRRSMWRIAQFDTLRLRLIKIAARVVEMKTMIRIHLPTSCPGQQILRLALVRIPRLVT
jgi:hypothetical protein